LDCVGNTFSKWVVFIHLLFLFYDYFRALEDDYCSKRPKVI
jgi:hypothetical protein